MSFEELGRVFDFWRKLRAEPERAPSRAGCSWGDDPADAGGRSPRDHALWLLARMVASVSTVRSGRGSRATAFAAWWLGSALAASFVLLVSGARRADAFDVAWHMLELREAPPFLTSGTAVAAVEWVSRHLRAVAVEAFSEGGASTPLVGAAGRAIIAWEAFVVAGLRARPCAWCGQDHGDGHVEAHAPGEPWRVPAGGVEGPGWVAVGASAVHGVDAWGLRYRTRLGPADEWGPPRLVLLALERRGDGWRLADGATLGVLAVESDPVALLNKYASTLGPQVMVSGILSPVDLAAVVESGIAAARPAGAEGSES